MGTSSVIANSRPSILYVFMHSLNRPRFTVCPGQTWNVPATFNEKLMSFHRPDWHFAPVPIRYLDVGSKQIYHTGLRYRSECECAVHRYSCLLQLDTSIFCSSRGAPEGLQCWELLVCYEHPLRRFSNRIDRFRNMPESAGCRALIHNPAPGKFKQVTEIVPPDS